MPVGQPAVVRFGRTHVRFRTILLSVGAHAGAFVAASRCTIELDPVRVPAAGRHLELVPAVSIEIVPIEVVLVDELTPGETSGEPVPTTSSPGPRVASAQWRAGTSASDDPVVEVAPPANTGMLAMRGRRHDLALSEGAANRIVGEGATPSTDEKPGDPRWSHDDKIKLVPSGGGNQEIRDRVAKFHVAPDGTVVGIESAPDFTFKLNLPNPSKIRKRIGMELDAWRKDPYRDTRVGRMQDLPRHLQAAPDACQSWNDPMCITAEDWQAQWKIEDEAAAEGALISGKADVTGYLHRKFVGDPYASRKLKILDQTRDDRVRAGATFRGKQLERSAELVQRNLQTLWRTVTDPAERRAALFAMWDECSEDESAAGAAGERARTMVIGWIRAHLPKTHPDAFSADDLARLDAARSSRQHFVPY